MKRNAKTMPLKPAVTMGARADGETVTPDAERDDTAYARDIGTFLQQFHLYAADWIGTHHDRRDGQTS